MLKVIPTLSGDAVSAHNYSLVFRIDETDYLFSFSYNRRTDRWSFNVDDDKGNQIIAGAVCVYGVDFFQYANPELRPKGILTLIWKSNAATAEEPGEFDLGKTCMLLHVDRAEDFVESPPAELPTT